MSDETDSTGWQSDSDAFPQFQSGYEFFQTSEPASGITHHRIPSLMELCLLFEQRLFEWSLWEPLNLKDYGYLGLDGASLVEYRCRRKLLLNIARFAYDSNDALLLNEHAHASVVSRVINKVIIRFPFEICQMISALAVSDFDLANQDERDGYRLPFKDEDWESLSERTKQMLLLNHSDDDRHHSSDTVDWSQSSKPGLFWDFQMYPAGLNQMLGEKDPIGTVMDEFHSFLFDARMDYPCLCPTPLIRDYHETGNRFICVNVLIHKKDQEMWMGVHSYSAFIQETSPNLDVRRRRRRFEWYRTPENGVYYYGGNKNEIRKRAAKKHSVDSRVSQDGCWGNIQHSSEQSVFRRIHLPFYQSGDWVSFKVDTLVHSMDVFLNNERIISNVDCSDLPMPWLFVAVVHHVYDFLYLEQVTDIYADDSVGFINGKHYTQ